jgi:hypothetical protein
MTDRKLPARRRKVAFEVEPPRKENSVGQER